MSNVSITVACGPYDHMEALSRGLVKPVGIDWAFPGVRIQARLSSLDKGPTFFGPSVLFSDGLGYKNPLQRRGWGSPSAAFAP